jgi:hypothetical protein
MTTGLYPQSFVVTFPQTVEIKGMQLISFGIKYLVVEKSSSSHPIDFDPISEKSNYFSLSYSLFDSFLLF